MDVKEILLDFKVSLGSVELPLLALGELQVGDILVFDQEAAASLPIKVAGEVKFLASLGTCHEYKGIQIKEVL